MGLITGLLTLPLAPVRGVGWVAEKVAEEAELELYDEQRILRELGQLEAAQEEGLMSEETFNQRGRRAAGAPGAGPCAATGKRGFSWLKKAARIGTNGRKEPARVGPHGREHAGPAHRAPARDRARVAQGGGRLADPLRCVELRRVPNSTDLLGCYAVTLDQDGEVVGYERRRRYQRGQTGGEDQ